MTLARVVSGHHDSAFINGPSNYGPLSIPGTGGKLTRLTAKGDIVFKGQSLAPDAILTSFLQHGWQQGFPGFIPSPAEGATFPPTSWFQLEGLAPATTAVAWAPSTGGGAVLTAQAVELVWHGQFFLSDAIDVYYSVGRFNNTGLGFGFWGQLEAMHT